MASFRSQYGCNTVRFNDMVDSLAVTSCYTPVGGVRGFPHGYVQTFTTAMDVRSSYNYDRPIFDCSWAINDENCILLASSNGTSFLIDATQDDDEILAVYNANNSSCTFSVHCHPDGNSFFSAHLDGSIHHWSLEEETIQHTYNHPNVVTCVTSDRRNPNAFSSSCYDGKLRIWDIRDEDPVIIIQADDERLVSCDWNFNGNRRIVTSSYRRNYLKVWDITMPNIPIKVIQGFHRDWIRRAKFSPHHEYQISSASYDSTVAIYDYGPEEADPIITRSEFHRSRVASVDMSSRVEGQMASCADDGFIYVWQHAVPEARSSSSPPPPSSSSSSTSSNPLG